MITKFINRQEELSFLEEKYRNKNFEFLPIYGRRRVGKTETILQFIKDKKAIYFLSTSGTKKENIEKFKLAAKEVIDLSIVGDDWESIFRYIKENIKNRLLIIIDEFPYLVETEKGLSSIFQRVIDLYLKDSNIFLLLCGSSLSMMYKEVLSYKAPLYGRRTGQIEVKPLKFKDAIKFFDKSFKETISIYSICGGVPTYLKEFIEGKSLIDLIEKKILSRGSLLREEVTFLLREEFRDPKVYLSIMSALSSGNRKLGEIINYCGFKDKTSITPYLRNLETLGYIRRELPITDKIKSKKGLYYVNDNFINFWLLTVRRNLEVIDKDLKLVLNNVKNELIKHVSFVFEDICREFLWRHKLIEQNKLGRWWNKNNEIDIVALNEQTKEILFGECKWSEKVNAFKILIALGEKIKEVEWYNKERKEIFVVFAKSFSKKAGEFEGRKVYCYELKDLEKVFKR